MMECPKCHAYVYDWTNEVPIIGREWASGFVQTYYVVLRPCGHLYPNHTREQAQV